MARTYRTDLSTLHPVERRADGTIRVDAHLTRCGVFQYMQHDGTIRKELRLPEDVFDQASLRSFEGVPVTNNHPPGMLDAKNTKQYAVGSQWGNVVRDDDHVRSKLTVFDNDTIAQMAAGKTQLSCGYTCDTVEQPGIHPLYGAYDAVQRNIRGNHVALVDRARAGITAAARMDAMIADGMMVLGEGEEVVLGVPLAFGASACKSEATDMAKAPTARVEVVVKHDATDAGTPSASRMVDPDDEASRNEKGENDAPGRKKEQPGQYTDRKGDVVRGAVPDDDDEDDDDDGDTSDASMYDAGGNLTPAGKAKIDAASFAVPGKQKLPIHDRSAVFQSKRDFKSFSFDNTDEKHAAFNRISAKGKSFGMDMAGFEKKYAGKLDRADEDNTMSEKIAAQAAADKQAAKLLRKTERKAKMDGLESANARLEAQVEVLEAKCATLEIAAKAHSDGADKSFTDRVNAKVELLGTARATGAAVEPAMTDRQIKCAVVKHVLKADIADAKHDAYVDAKFEGALEQAKTSAAETAKGANAIAAARTAVEGAPGTKIETRADGGEDLSEAAAKARMDAVNAELWKKPLSRGYQPTASK